MRVAIVTEDKRNAACFRQEPEPLFGTAPTALLEGLATLSQCEVHVLSCVQRPVRSPAKLAGNIYYHSMVVPKWGWMRGAYAGCLLAVRKKLREIKPDLVHGQGTERYCALAAAASGFPNVLTIHGNMRQLARLSGAFPFSFGWLAARLERFTLPRTRGVLCNSHHTQRLVRPLAPATWLVPNAVRNSFFSTPAVQQPSFPPILLNIGLIGPNKSQNEILEVAARLHERGTRFQLCFVGTVDEGYAYGADFRGRIALAEKAGYARYMGEKWGAELIDLMDSASALVHAPAEEAFGLVAAEGLARNLKFFGARVGGLVDIADGTDGAELFERGDQAGLEEALFQWLAAGHPKPTQAAQQMRARYHPTTIAGRHLEIYREVLNSSS
jgi:glycosyltransferase involved in cell wall biosynthesis